MGVLRQAATAAATVAEQTELAIYHEGGLVRAATAGLRQESSNAKVDTGARR
jgi:hypothetical protein